MKKSVAKRFKMTKRGKLLRRPMGVNHFRTRKTQKNVRKKRQSRGVDYPHKKIINY